MSMNKTTTKIASVVGAALLALSLASCSGGQSVAEACKIAEDTVSEASDQMETLMTDAMSGESNIKDLFAPISEALSDAEGKVSNPEVSAALKDISTEFTNVGELLGDLKMPNMADLDASDPDAMDELTKMQEDLEAISGDLETSGDALEKSGQKLQDLCGA